MKVKTRLLSRPARMSSSDFVVERTKVKSAVCVFERFSSAVLYEGDYRVTFVKWSAGDGGCTYPAASVSEEITTFLCQAEFSIVETAD
ncbi:hypothetical protein Trydic_g12174 [Trypoxylus dichotomus]